MEKRQIIFYDITYFLQKYIQVNYSLIIEETGIPGAVKTIIFPIDEILDWGKERDIELKLSDFPCMQSKIEENDLYNIQRFLYNKLNVRYIESYDNARQQIIRLNGDLRNMAKENWLLRNNVPTSEGMTV